MAAEMEDGLRAENVRSAMRLERLSLGWMIIEAALSIGAGVAAGSLLLIAFGADSVIELVSAGVLYSRLAQESRMVESRQDDINLLEARASRISGYLLCALSLYVLLQAAYELTHRHQADTSWLGLAVAVVACFGMPLLAKAKIRVADQIASRALRADAMETFTCGWLAWVLLLGLVANALLHWWWLDGAASLIIVPFLIKEAREALNGGCACSQE